MKLQHLFDGTFSSEFVIIHVTFQVTVNCENCQKHDNGINDNIEEKGSLILDEFIKKNVDLRNSTHLVGLERNPSVLRIIPNENFSSYCISDPSGWLKSTSEQAVKYHTNASEVLQQIVKTSKSESKTVVIIDSLALYFILEPESCYQTIHSLLNHKLSSGRHQLQLICLLHTDILPGGKKILKIFEQLATTNLIVNHINKQSLVTINHRKSSGRVNQTIEEFYIDPCQGFVTKEFNIIKEKSPEISGTNWMNSNVTFKLELEDKEKQARSELVLPYLKSSNQPKMGQIIYEPDANDDWDEEDPDDDLNI